MVTSKRGKATQLFASILITSNHMVFPVQFGIKHKIALEIMCLSFGVKGT